MGKNKQDSSKFTTKNKNTKQPPGNYKNKNAKNPPGNYKKNNSQDAKTKPQQKQPPRQNKAADMIRQKKQAEKAEKERRIMEFKKKRLEKTKVISKKTSRGQPLMKDRIEYLLKQIQEMKKH